MTQSSYGKIKLKRNNFYWLVHFISFTLIYSLWWLRLKQRAYNFFREGNPRRSTVTLKTSERHCFLSQPGGRSESLENGLT